MKKSSEKKTCIYPTAADCGEMSRFVSDPQARSFIGGNGVEGYDLIYIADIRQKQVFLFGTPQGTLSSAGIDPTQPVHERAHTKAAQGEVTSYEWSVETEKGSCFFQSTLIPLRDKEGKIDSTLGLVKNITDWDQKKCIEFDENGGITYQGTRY